MGTELRTRFLTYEGPPRQRGVFVVLGGGRQGQYLLGRVRLRARREVRTGMMLGEDHSDVIADVHTFCLGSLTNEDTQVRVGANHDRVAGALGGPAASSVLLGNHGLIQTRRSYRNWDLPGVSLGF